MGATTYQGPGVIVLCGFARRLQEGRTEWFSPFSRRLSHFDPLQCQLDREDPVGLKS